MEQCHNRDGGIDKAIVALMSEHLDTTGLSATKFAQTVASHAGKKNPTNIDEHDRLENRLKQQMSRILRGSTPLAADMIVPVIAALPATLADRATHSLFAPFGKVPCALPTILHDGHKPEPMMASIQAITNALSDLLARSQPAHDGIYDGNDHPATLSMMQDALIHLMSVSMREYCAIARATGVKSSYEQLYLQSPLFAGISSATTAAAQYPGQGRYPIPADPNAQY